MDIFRKAFPEKNIIFTFVVILLIGAILRFYNLDRESLWTDELASWKISSHNKVYIQTDEVFGQLIQLLPFWLQYKYQLMVEEIYWF